ncbi:MAG: ATP-binding protein [Novosphingobium aromaticivorans]|nr:ATP-binding protein [Novosphingobium aromaticivorans]
MPDPNRMIASFPLAVLLLDPAMVVAAVNPAAEQLLGQSVRRLVNRPLEKVLVFDEPLIVSRLADAQTHLVARKVRVGLAGQSARALDLMTAPVAHHPGWQMLVLHEMSGVEGLGDDVHGAGEGETGALRAPEVLAHEIKNPLAGIRGAAQLLDRKLGEADRALTGLITAEVDRIAKLIDTMQSLSRRIREPAVPCNLHVAIRRAEAIIAASDAASDRGVVPVREEFDPSLPPVMANPDALVQVMLNLMTNAREACEGRDEGMGGRQIMIRTRFASGIQVHSRGQRALRLPIEVRVSDNGPGVDPTLRDHIFEPFVTAKKHGQGLGLALVQKLVREMNGRITHDRDEEGGWTHFRLHLPVAGSVAEDAPEKRDPQEKEAGKGR